MAKSVLFGVAGEGQMTLVTYMWATEPSPVSVLTANES